MELTADSIVKLPPGMFFQVTAEGGDRPWIEGKHFEVDHARCAVKILEFPEGIELIEDMITGRMAPRHPPTWTIETKARARA